MIQPVWPCDNYYLFHLLHIINQLCSRQTRKFLTHQNVHRQLNICLTFESFERKTIKESQTITLKTTLFPCLLSPYKLLIPRKQFTLLNIQGKNSNSCNKTWNINIDFLYKRLDNEGLYFCLLRLTSTRINKFTLFYIV